MSSPLAGRSLLITGGTGSFGRAFVRRALDDGAARVVIYSRDEAKQAALLTAHDTDPRLRCFIGDVRDADRLRWALRGVDLLVHAAALKRIDTCEQDPAEAVATNVTGTLHVAQAAIREHVARAVFLSTDKAAAPCTLYGMTKATAERLWIQSNVYAAGTETRLSATRYGNVLGSTGSVVPMWRAEVERTGTLTLTDPDATRFWMTMPDAVALVLHAFEAMCGGETFVPLIGSASVDTLARAMVPDAVRRIVGLRAGEKRHETLISQDEASRTYDSGFHYVITPAVESWGRAPSLGRAPVHPQFSYRSDTNPRTLSVRDLQEMLP